MRLLDPGTGEVTDRLTILSLKILFGEQAGKEVSHFKVERVGLLAKIRSRDLNGVWFDKVLELSAVNAALWHAEDDLRDWRKRLAPSGPDSTGLMQPGKGYMEAVSPEVIALAFLIQRLNDQRAALVNEINKSAGDEKGVEKL